jgi:hypothetical protein
MINDMVVKLDKMVRYLIGCGDLSFRNMQKEISQKINTHAGNVSKAFSGDNAYLTSGFLDKINNSFGNVFNKEWILTGEGEMLHQEYRISGENTGITGSTVGGNVKTGDITKNRKKFIAENSSSVFQCDGNQEINNPNDVNYLYQVLEQKDALIEQKDKTIGYLRKQMDEQCDSFAVKLEDKEKRYDDAIKLFDERMMNKDELFKKANDEHRESLSILKKSLDTLTEDIREKDSMKVKLMEQIHELSEHNREIQNQIIELLKERIKIQN